MLSKLISGWAYNRDKNAFCRNFGLKGGWAYYRASTVILIGIGELILRILQTNSDNVDW